MPAPTAPGGGGERAKFCHLCGRRLWGRSWAYERDGQTLVVCRACQRQALRCDVCGVPMGERHAVLPDGRHVCVDCARTAIYDPLRAQVLFERVVGVAVEQLGLALNVGADFAMVDPQHLNRLAAEGNAGAEGNPDRIVGLFVRKGRRRVMYVLSGLPQIAFVHTVAHEWAHAWQGENCPLLKDPLVREGFAEWVAHKTLEALGAVKALAAMDRQDGMYGDGLRAMLALERRVGVAGVLDACRRAE
ncbi:MAG: zinc-binding protein [Anaerolineae bacterium]|nr:zinc-binding protein [Anaerolineae bacterium]